MRQHRTIAGALDQFANVVDAGVRRGIHLDHVDMARFDDGLAMDAERLHGDGGPSYRWLIRIGGTFVVERTRNDPCGSRLADTAHAAEEIGLVDAVEFEGVRQRLDHRLLTDQVGKARRPVFAGQHTIGHGRSRAGLLLDTHESSCGTRPPDLSRQEPGLQGRTRGRRLDRDPPDLVRAASFRT